MSENNVVYMYVSSFKLSQNWWSESRENRRKMVDNIES
ncbi:chlorite dismutase, partial [Sulfolobus sp. E3]